MRALVFDQFGGPEVLEYRELPDPPARPGHLQLEMKAIGLNFADVYRRRGDYRLEGEPPHVLGYEGVGVVVAGDADAAGYALGDRIGFADVPFANASRVNVPVDRAIPVPDDLDDLVACSLLLQGLTAQFLVSDSYSVQAGSTVLVLAPAGGVGQLLTQLAKARGATVIGLTSNDAKRAVAVARGADHCLLYSAHWPRDVRELSGGGVDVAYDPVGSTLLATFAAVRTRGTVVAFGLAGGEPPPVDVRQLMESSKTLVGAELWDHLTSRAERLSRAGELFDCWRNGLIREPSIETFPLSRGRDAHARLESRLATGKIILIPD